MKTTLSFSIRSLRSVAMPVAVGLALFSALFASVEAGGQTGSSSDRVIVEVIPSRTEVSPGDDVPIAVVFDIDHHWHIWPQPGARLDGFSSFETAVHTEIKAESSSAAVRLNKGFSQWPRPVGAVANLGMGEQEFAVFEGRTPVFIPLTIAADAEPGEVTLTFLITYQSCDDTSCLGPVIDEKHEVVLRIVPLEERSGSAGDIDAIFGSFDRDVYRQIHAGVRAPQIVQFPLFGFDFELDAASTIGFVLLLLLAAGGGFLLNLTPCVLPVIPLKIMALSRTAGSRSRTLALGVAMSFGVLAFWMGLGLVMATVKTFTATNQLFQYPLFTITVGIVIAIMAIAMCGLFSFRLPQAVYRFNPSHDTLHGSFAFGIMTAILSTPCTAPLMGAAAAWATRQSPGVILSVFGSIGTGMALPYLVLSAYPRLVERMPRSGPASELIKQVMGLLMLAAATYFIGVGLSGLMQQPGAAASLTYWWFVAFFIFAAGAWLAVRTIQFARSPRVRLTFVGIGAVLVIIGIGLGLRMTDKGPIDWVYYTPQRFADAKSDGKVVVMEFTAEWCLNCKALEQTVLRTERVVSLFSGGDVVPIKVDITNYEEGNRMLSAVNRVTIPLLVVFSPDGEEVFKSDAYTPQQVVDAVNEARSRAVASR